MRGFLLGWLAGAISMILWRAHLDGTMDSINESVGAQIDGSEEAT
jgi:hypothetical protein